MEIKAASGRVLWSFILLNETGIVQFYLSKNDSLYKNIFSIKDLCLPIKETLKIKGITAIALNGIGLGNFLVKVGNRTEVLIKN